jgi:hypothetical protein
MGYVDDAFEKLRQNLETTATEEKAARRRWTQIRDLVRGSWDLEDDFLTGSYRRHTKTKKLADVDIFVVLDRDGAQASLRKGAPTKVLGDLRDVLGATFERVTVDRLACVVPVGDDEDIVSFDVAPAFKRTSGDGYEIPDTRRGEWIATNPKTHHELSTAKNKECDERYVPLVKMLKGINREAGGPVVPSFLLEVMALEIVKPPLSTYQDEVRFFLATAADRVIESWADPAGLGPDVNADMTTSEVAAAKEFLVGALAKAEEAVWLEDSGSERAAVEKWRELFGWRMPRL